MTWAQVVALGPRAIGFYVVGFALGVLVWALCGGWFLRRTAHWHPLVRWLVGAGIGLVFTVLAQLGMFDALARRVHFLFHAH